MRFLKYLRKIFFGRYRRDMLKEKIKCNHSATFRCEQRLILGEYIYIGPNCDINAVGGVSIGSGTILGPHVVILSSVHDYNIDCTLPYDKTDFIRPVTIGCGVWIGYGAKICPGISIEDGAVIAMGSVVTKNIGKGEVVGGNPAKLLKHRKMTELEINQLVKDKKFFHKKYWQDCRPREFKD
ncbi:MAG: acyltransferase [Porticoccus sp.]|nr:acyltransferase [Porticoccus sp.]